MKYLILVVGLMIGLVACSGPMETIKIQALRQKDQKPIEIVAGEPLDSKVAKISLPFYSVGDKGMFKQGDIVEIKAYGIDFKKNTFCYIADPYSDSVLIILKSRTNNKIELAKKCDVINWNDPIEIPSIVVGSDLKPEQVIVTPLFNNKCERIGFQIRYGSTLRGCFKEGEEVINDFLKCAEKSKVNTDRSIASAAGSKTQPPTKVTTREPVVDQE